MKKGQGLVVYADRWDREKGLLRRFLPALASRMTYGLRGMVQERELHRRIRSFMAQDVPPLFSRLEIETINRCNAACSFCPVNRNAPQRPLAKMSEHLFEGIISQLADLGYRQSLSLYSNNEPLLDKRLPEFAVLAKARLPRARIKMFTNGTLLTLDTLRLLLPSFDLIFINNYNETPTMLPNIREIHDFCLTPEGSKLLQSKRLVIQLRNPQAVLSSRAGLAPNRQPPAHPPRYKCLYPFVQMVVRPDGKTSLCCNDALGKMTLGDLAAQSIADAWRGSAYAGIRSRMRDRGRAGIPLCAACDFQEWY